jgi:cysteinyl-tRNA synthetase
LIALLEQVKEISQATGLLSDSPGAWLARRRDRAVKMRGIDVDRVEKLIAQRSQARLARNFEESDRIRAELRTLGIELMDNPSATRWRVSG